MSNNDKKDDRDNKDYLSLIMPAVSNKKPQKQQQALGKGLSALLGNAPVTKEKEDGDDSNDVEKIVRINLDEIEINPDQPRKTFDEEALNNLADSIKSRGVLQPILVRRVPSGKYQVIAGERRYRASKIAGLNSIPCIVYNLSQLESLEIALIENVQREQLNPIEEAEAFKNLIYSFNYTHESLSKIIGKSRSYVTNHLRMLNLPDEVKEEIIKYNISIGHAKVIANVEEKVAIVKDIIENKLSVKDTEKLVRDLKDQAERQADNEVLRAMREISGELEGLIKKQIGFKSRVKLNSDGKSGKLTISFKDIEEIYSWLDKR